VPDAFALLSQLTLADVLRRLTELEAERRALLPIARGLRARERAAARRQGVVDA
jgi:hypothetical protein